MKLTRWERELLYFLLLGTILLLTNAFVVPPLVAAWYAPKAAPSAAPPFIRVHRCLSQAVLMGEDL